MNCKTIIDGIDVSKCEYYGKCSTYCCIDEDLCSGNTDCYFKQLARAKGKIEKIKDIILECRNHNDCNDCKYADECDNYPSNSEMMLDIIRGKENE